MWRCQQVAQNIQHVPVDSSGCFPCVGVDDQRLEVVLASALVTQLRASCRSLPCHQLTIEKVLGDESVFHAVGVAQPSHASLFAEGEHVRDAFSFEHCVVCHLDSPPDAKDASQAAHMKSVESPLLPGAQGPGFAAVQKDAHHIILVHLYLRVLCELAVCSDYFVQPVQCGSYLPNASDELGLKGEAVP